MHQEITKDEQSTPHASLLTIFFVFFRIGAFTFGGGYAMLPIIQREVIDHYKWVDFKTFSDILVITQSIPGALALNSSIQIGMRLRGILGGILAAFGIILPSFMIILIIVGLFLPLYKDNVYVEAIFYGLRPAIVALIAGAAVSLGRQLLSGWISIVLTAGLLAAALLLSLHPIVVLLAGGTAGLILFRKEEA